jgi:N-acetylneuraminic acid mutarotase
MRNFCLLFAVFTAFTGCKSSTEEELIGNWVTIGDFDGSTRNDATGFVIGDTAYICLGYNVSDKSLNDLYRYDPTNKTWERRANFPGEPRFAAVSFTANKKAYVGLGYNGTTIYKDFWEYDPATGVWTEVADEFPGEERYFAVGASVNNTGIVGTGTNNKNDLKDFYTFTPGSTPGSGTWKQISGYEGSKRQGASCFVIDKYLYVLGGTSNKGYPVDMQKYDLANNKWQKVLDLRNTDLTTDDDKYDNIPRAYASTFVINNKAYITLGEKANVNTATTYEYDPSTNKWVERTGFSRSTRTGAVSFSLSETSKSRGLILTGKSGTIRFDDFFEFFPTAANSNYDD